MAELTGGAQALLLTTCTMSGLVFVVFVVAAGISHWWAQMGEAFERVLEGWGNVLD